MYRVGVGRLIFWNQFSAEHNNTFIGPHGKIDNSVTMLLLYCSYFTLVIFLPSLESFPQVHNFFIVSYYRPRITQINLSMRTALIKAHYNEIGPCSDHNSGDQGWLAGTNPSESYLVGGHFAHISDVMLHYISNNCARCRTLVPPSGQKIFVEKFYFASFFRFFWNWISAGNTWYYEVIEPG